MKSHKLDDQGTTTEDDRNDKRETPQTTQNVGGNDAVQANENTPAGSRPAIETPNGAFILNVPLRVFLG